MNIVNAKVLSADCARFIEGGIAVRDGKIESVGNIPSAGGDYDAQGLFVIPGMIDTHIHGSVAVEFASPDEDFERARVWLARQGITSFAATVRALPAEKTVAAIKNIVRESKKDSHGAKLKGIHIEGPFVSKERSGVMNPPDEICQVETFEKFVAAGEGLVKIMTLAPERENALEVIRRAVQLGVNISIGHTMADYGTARAAVNAGACRATHVFNAMRPFAHRDPGVLGEVLTDPRVNCEMICDLVHNAAPTVEMVYKLKGAKGLTLVSDTGYMSGLGDGEFNVDGRIRYVKDEVCRNAEGRIAGSTVSMLAGAKNLLKLGVPLCELAVIASGNPAEALGIGGETGSISVGSAADLIVCDGELNIRSVFVDGRIVGE